MRGFIVGLASSVIATICGGTETIGLRRVDPEAFRELIAKGDGVVLDVRTPEEVAQGVIGDAKVINFYDGDFKERVARLPKDEPVHVYCRSGGRSGRAARLLKQLGFEQVYDLRGGITAWGEAGYPLKKPNDEAGKTN